MQIKTASKLIGETGFVKFRMQILITWMEILPNIT